jgi:SAM-dependent methyltransferase
MKQKYSYTEDFYKSVDKRASDTAKLVFTVLNKYVRVSSIVDAGCGSGAWIRTAIDTGIQQAIGLDLASSLTLIEKNTDFKKYLEKGEIVLVERDFVFDPTSHFPKADLAVCLEVLEHLPPEVAVKLVARLAEASDFILFSAAQPGQGGTYHINEREIVYWVTEFAKFGFDPYDPFREILGKMNYVPRFYSLNMILFVSRDALQLDEAIIDRSSLLELKISDSKLFDKRTILEKIRYKIVGNLPVSVVTALSKRLKY